MNTCPWLQVVAYSVLALAILAAAPAKVALAQDGSAADDQQLAETYAPVLYFHADELFRPQSVDVMVNSARLRQARPLRLHINVLPSVALSDLQDYEDPSYNLDAWLGDEGSSDYKNYSAHRSHYQAELSTEAGGPPVVAYAHVVRDEDSQQITIQYWLFYYYNDWFNKHEGDWEVVQVVLDATGEPEWLVLSQHHGGTRRPWSVARLEGTHPAVYVALGSHANYFRGDETYPCGVSVGDARLEIVDRTGATGRTIPEVILMPDRVGLASDAASWPGFEWLLFAGSWGEVAPQSDFSGPRGPADKGDQWEQPYAWGMAQPLDADAWYANRVRVQVVGDAGEGARVALSADRRDDLHGTESLGDVALLHADPDPDERIRASIHVPQGQPYTIVATWPDAEASEVIRYRFENVPPGPSGLAVLTLEANRLPTVRIAEVPRALPPSTVERVKATWDAPDLAWAIGVLPADEVARGIILSLLAGLLPCLFYVMALYWADRYEKEPVRLLAAAFLWGAVPALLLAVAVRLFFRLPLDLLGPKAVQAVQAGLLTPLIEEALKGAVILFIAWRYRFEFDNVLDGILYGAMVGIGFAMTGNTLSYLGAFLVYGFDGLGSSVFVEGVLYGLNHALYSAIFGAGLGYARLARRRWKRWVIPLAAFALAVAAHALHSLAIRSTMGWNLLTVAVTWAGLLVMVVVMAWSLGRQRRCLAAELADEVPAELYQAVITPGDRFRAQWRALTRHGLRGLGRVRRLHQQCAELAFKKMQYRRRPDEPRLSEEVVRQREVLQAMMEGGHGAAVS